LGFLVVTHRFHPLFGQRLPVLFVKRRAGGVVYVCEGSVGGRATVTFAEGWTDRGPAPATHRLSVEALVVLDTLVMAIVDLRERKADNLV
jgi:ABC-type hemin transport system substrate-binding protein